LQVELARIDAEHQTWLRERGLTEPLESGPRRRLPPDTMAPE
jgi:hypothetical protein